MSTERQTLNQHAPLDYVVFKLTTTRTRCEVLASAGEITEKLATGLARPFIAHIQAVEDQIANGSHFVELVPSRNVPGSADLGVPQPFLWFTKGTVEKVIRFVNSPQLLERIIAIDVELKQLEDSQSESLSGGTSDRQAKSDVGHSYPHMRSPGRSSARSSSPARSPSPVSRTPKKSSNDDLPEENHDSSRRRWSAIEARKSMLRRELNVALARANAAGFLEDEMPSVQTFAEFFGAARLRDACKKYRMVLKRKTTVQTQKIRSETSKSRRFDLDESGSVRSDPGPSVLNPMPISNVPTRFPVTPVARHMAIPSPSVRSISSEPGGMIKAKSYPETYASSETSSGFDRDFLMDSAMMRYSSAPDVHSMEESQSISGGESMGENSDSVEAVQRSIGSGRGSASASSSGVSSEASDAADTLNPRSRSEEFVSAASQSQSNESFIQNKTGADPKHFASSTDRPWEKNSKAIVPYTNKPETPQSPSHYSASPRRASDISAFRESLDVDLLVCPDSPLPRRSSWHSTTAPSSTLLDKSDTSSVASFGSLRKDVRKSRVETNPVGVGRGSGNPVGVGRGSRSPEVSSRFDSGDVTPVLGSRKESPPSRRKESSDWLPSVMKSMTPFLDRRQSPSLVSSRPQSPSPSYKEISFSPKSSPSSERDSSDKSSQNGIRRSMSQDTGINLVKQSFMGTKAFPSNPNLSPFPLPHSYLTNSIPKSPSFPTIRSSMESLSPNDGSKSMSDSKIQEVDKKSFAQIQTKASEDGSLSGLYHREFETPERPPSAEAPKPLEDQQDSSAPSSVEASVSKTQEISRTDPIIDAGSPHDAPSETKPVELMPHSETASPSSPQPPTSQPVAEVSSSQSPDLSAPSSSSIQPLSPLSNPPTEGPSTSGTEATKPTEPSTTSIHSPLDPTSNSLSGHPASSTSPGHLDMRFPLSQPPDPLVPGWGVPLTSLPNSSSVYPTPGQFIPPHPAGYVLPGGSQFLHPYPYPSPDASVTPGPNQMYYWPFMGNSVLPSESRAPASPGPGGMANHPYLPSWASHKPPSEGQPQSLPNKKTGINSDSSKATASKEELDDDSEDGKEEKNSKKKGAKQFPVKKKNIAPVRRVVVIKNIQYVPDSSNSVQIPPLSGEKQAPLQTVKNVIPQNEIPQVESKPTYSVPDPYEPSVEEFMMLNSKDAWSYRERRSNLGEEDLRGIAINFEPVNPKESVHVSLPPELDPVSSMEKKESRTELKEEDFRGVIKEPESSKIPKSQNAASFDPMINFISWATSNRTKSPVYSIQEADLRGSDPTLDSNEPETMKDVKSPAARNPSTSTGLKTKSGSVNGRRTSTVPTSRSRPSPFDTGNDTVAEAQLRAQERLKQRKLEASKKQEEEKKKLEAARARRLNKATNVDSMDLTSRLTRPTASSLQQSIAHGPHSIPSKTPSSASTYSRRASMGGEAIARKGPSPVRPSAWGSSSRF